MVARLSDSQQGGYRITPSVVAIMDDGKKLVGADRETSGDYQS